MAMQASDDYKARILDETQSNPYVGGKTGKHRAQAATREYLETLATAPGPIGNGATKTPSSHPPARRPVRRKR